MAEPLFTGAGRLRPHYEAVDWAGTSLGRAEGWPEELRLTLATVLSTRFPATLLWGPALVLLYNEAYVALVGDKHPCALGRPAQEVFPEAWPDIGPLISGVMEGRGPTWVEDWRLVLERRGFAEECFFTFSYSPVLDADGRVAGVLDIAAETTRQVLDRRWLGLVATLGHQLADLDDPAALPATALPLLRVRADDLAAVGLVGARGDGPLAEGPGGGVPGGGPAGAWDVRLPAVVPPELQGVEQHQQQTPEGTVVWSRLRGDGPPGERPLLAVLLSRHLLADDYLRLVDLVVLALSTALDRARARALEREAADAARSMSARLQRSLLTDLPQPDHLQLAARYQPAAKDQQIGGDWYDAFLVADGGTSLVVGDVTGHDRGAAVAMAQVRNVLRGVAYALAEPPAVVLDTLDHAIRDLAVGALATALLARVEQPEELADRHLRLLRWSNAGHPPPLLVHPGGRAELLTRPADLLLGLDVETVRHDHRQVLHPGSTVLLFSDGLVERRGRHLGDGLAWLVETVERLGSHRLPLDALCDALLAEVGDRLEDDVVLLALRAFRDTGDRPSEAGPEVVPAGTIAPGDGDVHAQRPSA